jgi:putative phosphoesterase
MKLGILSDIHGDIVALELAWAHLTVMGVDRIVCAGDVVGYGPHPDRVVAFLVEHQIDAVRGNHDRWALERPPGTPDPFRGGTPSAETLAYLEALPPDRLIADGPKVGVLTHGAPGDDMEFLSRPKYTPELLDALLDGLTADLLIVGHTHKPMWYRSGDRLVINPGSVIGCRVMVTSRTFAVFDWDARGVTFHEVESGARQDVPAW